jgi:arginyl-tRNA synthetase
MTAPLRELTPLLGAAVATAFGPEYVRVDPMLRPSRHADYQANLAMGLGKTLGRPSREVATSIVEHLSLGGALERAEVAGPGFINLWVAPRYLAEQLERAWAGDWERATAPSETVVVDYSSPNAAKEMHVGHLRSTILGDALARVFEALGHRVVRQNHLGDWGTPFGMLIEHLLDARADTAEATDVSVTDLSAFYQTARRKFEQDEAFAERARRRVVGLQGGDPETLALWRKLVAVSTRYFDTVYQRLGVSLADQHIAGESLYNPWLGEVVGELAKLGLAVESDGAMCVFPPGFTGRDDQPVPLIVRKQDGGYGYAATDLAAIRYRVRTLGATRILYVVGAPQAQHLSMVFAVARVAGWLPPPTRAEHVSFGAVLGSDKKMFRTRAGETIRLIDLLDEAVTRADAIVREKNPDLDRDSRERIARAVGIGAVKYADLASDRGKDYVFDWNRMLSFDGNTAPYLQYAHARIRSIFRKGSLRPGDGGLSLGAPEEKTLALALLTFPAVVEEVAETLLPHKLCGYLYDLATTFSAFYESCPVLRADTPEERVSRLKLCGLTARALAQGLGLLGIEAPELM